MVQFPDRNLKHFIVQVTIVMVSYYIALWRNILRFRNSHNLPGCHGLLEWLIFINDESMKCLLLYTTWDHVLPSPPSIPFNSREFLIAHPSISLLKYT